MNRRWWLASAAAGIAAASIAGRRALRQQLAEPDAATKFDPEDPEAAERAVRYTREQERLFFISAAWGVGSGLLALRSRLPTVLARRLDSSPLRRYRLPLFVAAWSGLEWLTSMPLSWYGGYAVERRYGLSTQSIFGWLKDQLKVLGLGMGLGVPVLTGLYYIIQRFPRYWWLVVSALSLPFTVLLAQLYPVLIAPIFNKYEPLGDPALEERIRRLAEREGVHVSSVMKMDMSRQTSKANAFFAGIGRTKRIVLADTMLSRFTPDEIEAVLAHELGHQVHHDTWKLVGVGSLSTLTGAFAVHKLFAPAARLTGSGKVGDVTSLPLLSLLTSLLGLAGMPLLNAYSRSIERSADDYALRLTRDPAAFIGAMRRLQQMNLVDPDPPALIRLLLHGHPTIGERVRRAASLLEPRQ